MRGNFLKAMVALGLVSSAWSPPALAEDQTGSATPYDAETAAAFIADWQERDLRKDPKGALEALMAFYESISATSNVPPEQMADAATLVGTAYFADQEYEASIEWFARAGAIWATIPDRRDKQAEMLNNQGVLHRALKRLSEAELSLRQALAIRTELYGESHEAVSSSMFSLGNVLFSQGRFEDALPLFRKVASEQAVLTPDRPDLIVQRMEGLGAALDESGRDTEALSVMREAEALARRELGPDHQVYGTVSHNLALVLADLGLHEQAIEMSRQAVDIRRKTAGEDSPWTASSISHLATSLAASGENDAALTLHREALRIMQDNRNVVGSENIARVLNEMAQILAVQEDWDAFFATSDQAIAEVDSGLDEIHPMRAATHLLRAGMLEQLGRTAEALPIAEEWVAVQIANLIPENRQRIEGELLLARLRQAQGSEPEAYWPLADSALGRLRARLTDLSRSESERAGESRANIRSAILYLRMALERDDHERAIEAAQLANISALSLSIDGQLDGDSANPAAQLYLEFRAAAREEARLSQYRAFAVSTDDAALALRLAREVEGQAARKNALAAELQTRHADWLQRFRPEPLALSEIRNGLAADERLVLVVEGPVKSWALHVSSNGPVTIAEMSSKQIATRVAELRDAFESRATSPFPLASAHDLYRAIFGDAGHGSGRISVYGGARLASVPFAALITRPHDGALQDAPWLVRDVSLRTLGNLQTLPDSVAPQGAATDVRFAGVGGVVPPGLAGVANRNASLFRAGGTSITAISDLEFLPAAEDELRGIAKALNAVDPLLLIGPAASEAAFKRTDLSQKSVIAFATHGLIAGEIDGLWEPSLLLGGAGENGEDGLLGASEIARLELAADWVILSACNSASGSSQIAPPFSGLATAFSQAGARALLVSHWPLRDDAGARMSVETVSAAASGLARDEALRRAQLSLIASDLQNGAHPSIWAPLALVE